MSIMYEGGRRLAKKQHETDKNNDVADPESEQNFYIPNPMEGQRGGKQKQEGRKKPPSETVCDSLLALVRRELVPARLDAYHHDKEQHQDDASPPHRVTAPSGSSGLSEPSSAIRQAERA